MSAKAKNIVSWTLSILLGLAFTGSGLSKIAGAEMQVQNFISWGFPDWARYPVGLSEVTLAIGLVLPRTRRITSLLVFGWAIGAVLTHVQAGQFAQIGAPLPFALLNTLVFFLERSKQKDLSLSVSNA